MANTTPTSTRVPVTPTMRHVMTAEFFGTFMLIFFGLGAVHASVLTGAQSGLWQVAIVWGIAIMLAIYTVGTVSGAHINPAMTIALAVWGKHPWRRVLPYCLAQVAGAFLAAAVLYGLFSGFIEAKEKSKDVTRGTPGSVVTAMCYGEYYPSPGSLGAGESPYSADEHAALNARFSHRAAWFAEFLGTMILACVVFALGDDRNKERCGANLAPVFVGLTVAALISVIAPLTQACFNPARDFGPRIFACLAGWRDVAFPGLLEPSWLTVYIIAPIVGACVGGGVYQLLLRPIRQTDE